MTEAFERNLTYLRKNEVGMQPGLKDLHLFLQVLPKKEYINAILREIRQLANSSDAYSESMSYLYLSLGKYIYKKYEVRCA